jgi:transcriptional regulator with XRE-family HTH domain
MSASKSHQQTIPQLFGTRVREVRESRRLSQGELAKLVAIDRTTLNKIERGSRGDVSISQLFAFAAALEISPLYLVTPQDGSEPVVVTANLTLAAAAARAWIRGAALPGKDPIEHFLDLPRDEQRALLARERTDRLVASGEVSPLVVAAAGGTLSVSEDEVERIVEHIANERREPKNG